MLGTRFLRQEINSVDIFSDRLTNEPGANHDLTPLLIGSLAYDLGIKGIKAYS